MSTQNEMRVDEKIVARVRKLLALAADGSGATEAEAALAAERAAEIMAEHGISVAEAEARGEEGERRERGDLRAGVNKWHPVLMEAIAESCYVLASHSRRYSGNRPVGHTFDLIGRASAVATARVMFEYLTETVNRLGTEFEAANPNEPGRYFRRGCAERVAERIRERHARRLREQREEAERRDREAAARASHPSAASSSTALAVVLEDYALREADFNRDVARGAPPGTTARERRERDEAHARHLREREEKRLRLISEGTDEDVAEWMSLGYGRAEAERLKALYEEKPKPETEAQRRSRERREDRRNSRGWRTTAEERKRDSGAWRAGRERGESVGLDGQIARGTATGRLK